MSTLAEHLHRWPDGDGVVLFCGLTGRGVRLHTQTVRALDDGLAPAPVLARLRRLHLLKEAPPDLASLLPVVHHVVLLRPDLPALWAPLPAQHTHGGYAYRQIPLDPQGLAVWRAINGTRTLKQVAEHLALDLDEVLRALAPLTAPEVQAVQLRDSPPHPRDPALVRLFGAPRAAHPRPTDQLDRAGATTLSPYHLQHITDGSTHFDDRETTVAHVCSAPHPALGGRRYGEALFDALCDLGLPLHGQTLEIGCGTGDLAAAWLSRGPTAERYLRVDLSPELLRTQAQRVSTPAILADGTRLPLAEATIDLILSNEVLADLTAIPWAPGDASTPEAREVAASIQRFGLTAYPHRAWYNLGAWRLVQEASRALRPGGAAVLNEFGTLDEAPEEAVQLDHPEVSIQFTQLAEVARGCGLHATILRLDQLLGMDLHALQLSRTSWYALRALARAHGVHLPARLYTPQTLEQAIPWPLENLRWTSCADEGPGPLITRFYALVLRKPE